MCYGFLVAPFKFSYLIDLIQNLNFCSVTFFCPVLWSWSVSDVSFLETPSSYCVPSPDWCLATDYSSFQSLKLCRESRSEVLLGQAALLPSNQTLLQCLFMRHKPDARLLITGLCDGEGEHMQCVCLDWLCSLSSKCLCSFCAVSMGEGNGKLALRGPK